MPGGIRTLPSAAVTRRTISLHAGSPARTAAALAEQAESGVGVLEREPPLMARRRMAAHAGLTARRRERAGEHFVVSRRIERRAARVDLHARRLQRRLLRRAGDEPQARHGDRGADGARRVRTAEHRARSVSHEPARSRHLTFTASRTPRDSQGGRRSPVAPGTPAQPPRTRCAAANAHTTPRPIEKSPVIPSRTGSARCQRESLASGPATIAASVVMPSVAPAP